MAMRLIQEWELSVLRVELDVSERRPMVRAELAAYPGGSPRPLWSTRYPLSAFGLDSGRTPPTRLSVPADLPDEVEAALLADGAGPQLAGTAGTALWLRLVPPYGYLGAVPWEPALTDVVPLLLRVPDRLPAAVDPGRTFTAVIAICARSGTRWAAPYVRDLLGSLHRTVPGPLEVHVFADAETVAQLDADPGVAESWQHVHRPADARRVSQDRTDRAATRSDRRLLRTTVLVTDATGRIWADWIANGLGGRAARALHVVLEAAWNGERPVLALSPDPVTGFDAATCAFVEAEQVRHLSDMLGAATLSFGSPPDNGADAATRMIVDSLGRQRHGPTFYSSVADDPDGRALALAFRYVVSLLPIFPQHRSLFAYLQPEHVARTLDRPWPDEIAGPPRGGAPQPELAPESADPAPTADLTRYYAAASSVPSWVAASERFVEAGSANLSTTRTGPLDGFEVKQAYNRGAAAALGEIKDLLAQHVRES